MVPNRRHQTLPRLLSQHAVSDALNAGVTMRDCIEAAAVKFLVSAQDVEAGGRTMHMPRAFAIEAASQLMGLNSCELGRAFGKDHSTIRHARSWVAKRVEDDPEMRAVLMDVISAATSSARSRMPQGDDQIDAVVNVDIPDCLLAASIAWGVSVAQIVGPRIGRFDTSARASFVRLAMDLTKCSPRAVGSAIGRDRYFVVRALRSFHTHHGNDEQIARKHATAARAARVIASCPDRARSVAEVLAREEKEEQERRSRARALASPPAAQATEVVVVNRERLVALQREKDCGGVVRRTRAGVVVRGGAIISFEGL